MIWAQYLWHPQQTQFFALLTSYLFYRAIRCTPISPRYLYPSAAAFIATYLSWEGSGFLLPALGLGVAVVQGKDLSWLRNKHLWIAVSLVSLAVALRVNSPAFAANPISRNWLRAERCQYAHPLLSRSHVRPHVLYQKPVLAREQCHLTLLALGMLPPVEAIWICILLHAPVFGYFLMTTTLSNASIRYAYYLQPFLICRLLVSLLALWTI